MKNKSVKYKVYISFVDDSYWDDGSRWTSALFKFDKRQDAVKFANDALTNGITVDGQNGEIKVRPEARDISLFKETVSEIDF